MKKCTICEAEHQGKSSRCPACEKAYQAGRYSKKKDEGVKKPRKNGRPNQPEVERLKQILGASTDSELCGLLGGVSMNTINTWKTKIPPHVQWLMKIAGILYKHVPAKAQKAARKDILSGLE